MKNIACIAMLGLLCSPVIMADIPYFSLYEPDACSRLFIDDSHVNGVITEDQYRESLAVSEIPCRKISSVAKVIVNDVRMDTCLGGKEEEIIESALNKLQPYFEELHTLSLSYKVLDAVRLEDLDKGLLEKILLTVESFVSSSLNEDKSISIGELFISFYQVNNGNGICSDSSCPDKTSPKAKYQKGCGNKPHDNSKLKEALEMLTLYLQQAQQ